MKDLRHLKIKWLAFIIITLCAMQMIQIVVATDTSYTITAFSVSPAAIGISGSARISITAKANSDTPNVQYVTCSISDVTQSSAILNTLMIFMPKNNRKEVTYSFDIPHSEYSITTAGTHKLKAEMRSFGVSPRVVYDSKEINLDVSNSKPSTPCKPVGPKTITAGETHTYYFVATDPDMDDLAYRLSVNGISSEWGQYFKSGVTANADHTFSNPGSYTLKVQAKDKHNKASDVSDYILVTVASCSSTVVYPEITLFKSEPSTISVGGSASVTWSSKNADRVVIDHGVNPTSAITGSVTVSPTETTEYTAIAYNGDRTVVAYCKIEVEAPAPSVTITADKTNILIGDSVTLRWSSEHASKVEITQGIATNNALSGSYVASPKHTTTYTATAAGTGTASDSVTVYVVGQNGEIITDPGNGMNEIFTWLFVGILAMFIVINLLYFQKKKKWIPYGTYLKKILAWIKNKEYEEEPDVKKSSRENKSYYDYLVEYGDTDKSEATHLYRRKRKVKRKKKKRKGGEK